MRRARLLLLSTLLALLLPVGAAGATVGTPKDGLPEGVGIRVLDVPTAMADDPRANVYVVDHAIPGAVVRRSVEVSNGTDEPMPIQMRGVSARATDEWLVDDDGAPPTPDQLAAWITVEPSSFVLAADAVTTVEVTIAVPAEAPPGERYAAVVAEPPAVDGGGVSLVSRVGVRVYLSVGGSEPVTDFQIDTLTAARDAAGVPLVEVGVTNTGERAVDVSGELQLASEDGLLTAGPFPTVLPSTLGPGNRGSVFVELPADLSVGPWVATATMRSGLLERQARATISFPSPEQVGTAEDPVAVERIEATRRALLPVATALLLLAVVALWMLLQWKRRDEEEQDTEEGAAETVAGDGSTAP